LSRTDKDDVTIWIFFKNVSYRNAFIRSPLKF
jgi:hypothetical protein